MLYCCYFTGQLEGAPREILVHDWSHMVHVLAAAIATLATSSTPLIKLK